MAKIYRPALCLLAILLLCACSSQKQSEVAATPQPLAIEMVYQEGRAAYEAEKYTEAAEKFAQVAQADPQHLNALINWGSALSRSGQPDKAIPKFQQALLIDGTKAEAYYNWGVALARLGKHQEAIEKYESALALRADLITTPGLQHYLERHRLQEQETRIKAPVPTTPAPGVQR
jgi:tetratricopeptide (TPR) repeat protein